MKFHWSTIGHDSVKRYVESMISLKRLPAHGFLIVGPEHIGKTTFVRELVSCLMCESEETKPCGTCIHCSHLNRDAHPDVYRLRPSEDRVSIVVDDVRIVTEQLQTSSFFKQKKVCLIEEAQSLTPGASNALLKSLEEPSGETIFLFISNSEQAILPTIASRCQIIRMYPLSTKLIYDALMERGVTPGEALELSRFSAGHPGIVWRFVQHEADWAKEKASISKEIGMLFGNGALKHEWYEDTDTIPFQHFVQYTNDALLVSLQLHHLMGCSFNDFNFLKGSNLVQYANVLEACARAIKLRSQNVNPKLVLDMIHGTVRDVI